MHVALNNENLVLVPNAGSEDVPITEIDKALFDHLYSALQAPNLVAESFSEPVSEQQFLSRMLKR